MEILYRKELSGSLGVDFRIDGSECEIINLLLKLKGEKYVYITFNRSYEDRYLWIYFKNKRIIWKWFERFFASA